MNSQVKKYGVIALTVVATLAVVNRVVARSATANKLING